MAQNIDDFESQKRTKMVGVKLTPNEFDELKEHCDDIGVTISRFFRYLYTEDKSKRDRKRK